MIDFWLFNDVLAALPTFAGNPEVRTGFKYMNFYYSYHWGVGTVQCQIRQGGEELVETVGNVILADDSAIHVRNKLWRQFSLRVMAIQGNTNSYHGDFLPDGVQIELIQRVLKKKTGFFMNGSWPLSWSSSCTQYCHRNRNISIA